MSKPISPVAAVIQYVSQDTDLAALIGGQVAEKHKFSMPVPSAGTTRGWATPSMALRLRPDPGATPDVSAGQQRIRLEAACYGRTPAECEQVYMALVQLCRRSSEARSTVQTGNGLALLYYIIVDSSVSLDIESEVTVDKYVCYLRAAVSEQAVD